MSECDDLNVTYEVSTVGNYGDEGNLRTQKGSPFGGEAQADEALEGRN